MGELFVGARENGNVVVERGRLRMAIGEGFGPDGIVITAWDDRQLLGRIVADADTVAIWQPNDLDGPTFEWVGMGME